MKNTGKIFWGIILIIVGVIVALNVLEITDIDIFFDGWWTLFLIIPGLIGIFRSGDRLGSLFLLIFGAALLLAAQNIIEYDMIWKMLLPIALVFIGLKMIFGNIFKHKERKRHLSAVFSDERAKWDNEVFGDNEFNCVFGDLKIALENAIIEKDVTIKINAVFGDVRISVPHDVNVRVNSSMIFGDIKNKRPNETIAFTPTLTIEASGVFSDIKID